MGAGVSSSATRAPGPRGSTRTLVFGGGVGRAGPSIRRRTVPSAPTTAHPQAVELDAPRTPRPGRRCARRCARTGAGQVARTARSRAAAASSAPSRVAGGDLDGGRRPGTGRAANRDRPGPPRPAAVRADPTARRACAVAADRPRRGLTAAPRSVAASRAPAAARSAARPRRARPAPAPRPRVDEPTRPAPSGTGAPQRPPADADGAHHDVLRPGRRAGLAARRRPTPPAWSGRRPRRCRGAGRRRRSCG